MSAARQVRRWEIPSSDGARTYAVTFDEGGAWACSCPNWIYRRGTCKHILAQQEAIEAGEIAAPTPRKIVLANVPEVSLKGDDEVLTPLVPLGGGPAAHFTVTVAYDLVRAGVPWPEVKRRYHLQAALAEIKEFVRAHGRLVHGPFRKGRGYDGYRPAPADAPLPVVGRRTTARRRKP